MPRAALLALLLAACTPQPPVTTPPGNSDAGCPSCVEPPDAALPVDIPDAALPADAADAADAAMPVDAAVPLPDLTVDEAALRRSVVITQSSVGSQSCVMQEGCVGGPGNRKLLRFTTSTPNIGDADLVVGDAQDPSRFTYSACHGHYHFNGFATYELVDADGGVAAIGHKQSFCLSDTAPVVADAGPGKFTCDHQGITAGWMDTYVSTLDCQWIDVTDVPPGDYTLRVEANPEHLFEEQDFTNNVATAPVTIAPEGMCIASPEVCHDGKDQDCDGEVDNGCAPLDGNNACESAFPVESGTFFATLGGAGSTFSCGSGVTAYFSLQLTAAEMVFISSHGSEGDTSVALLDGECGSEHACVASTCDAPGAHLLRALNPGDYTIAVTGEPGARVQLKVTRAPCASVRVVGDLPAGLAGNTAGRANTTGTACGNGDGPEEHFALATCPGDQALHLSTCGGTNFDSILQVREDSCEAPGIMSMCNDDGFPVCNAGVQSSSLDVTLRGNTLHFITVDGFDAMDRGSYTLTITHR